MKKCPYCSEEIQDEAAVCRYCGRDLTTGALAHPSEVGLPPPPPPPGHAPAVHGTPAMAKAPGNVAAVASLPLGILALIFFWAQALPVVLSALGIILGALGRQRARAGGGSQGLATAGLVISIIALVLALIIIVAVNG